MRYATGLIRDAGRLLHLLVAILTCAYFANRKNLIVNAASGKVEWKFNKTNIDEDFKMLNYIED